MAFDILFPFIYRNVFSFLCNVLKPTRFNFCFSSSNKAAVKLQAAAIKVRTRANNAMADKVLPHTRKTRNARISEYSL